MDANVDASAAVALRRAAGAGRVLWLSTVAFTAMFAVWLMFGVIGIPIQKEFGLTDVQFAWLGAVAVLNGSIWRLWFGILSDRLGGRRVFTALLLMSAASALAIVHATTFGGLLVCAFLVGIAGNSFSAGIAWNAAWFPRSRQGVALGTFGAGNVGASVTKLFGPSLIAAVPAAGLAGGWYPGGWRAVPVAYAVLLTAIAAGLWLLAPADLRLETARRSMGQMLRPLRQARVWRFSLYYVVVFGAYVALSLTLPKYYIATYHLSLKAAALLTALFIFPASLLRPLGGYISDQIGPRSVMYGVFSTMLLTTGLLAYGGPKGLSLGIAPFTSLVFIMGVAMGLGKAAVYKYVPEYFPRDIAAVGGLVGALGALGGFVLPLLFGYLSRWSGLHETPFAVMFGLTGVSFAWLHAAVRRTRASSSAVVGTS